MKLKFKNTPQQVELIKAMGSKRPEVSREASEAFAALSAILSKHFANSFALAVTSVIEALSAFRAILT